MNVKLYEQIASYSYLLRGFDKVVESDGAPGIDGISIINFEENLDQNISLLNHELTSFQYTPKPLLMFVRIKSDGKTRTLFIPAVRDRVAQSSAYLVLSPIIDKHFENESFAYREGFSREAAARKIASLYNDGFVWVVDADITKYFDNINHDLLLKRFSEIVNEEETIELISKWIKAEYISENRKNKFTKGVPQGSVISPLLANLYLDKFDEEVTNSGYKLVRYADDFIILTKSKTEAEKALKLTGELLKSISLELNPEKTTITNFDLGFKYLGYIFLRSLVTTALPKDTSRPLGYKIDEKQILEKQQLFKKHVYETDKSKEEISPEKLSATTVGSALLEALSQKGIELKNFLDSLNKEAELNSIPGTKDDVETILLSEDIAEEESKELIPHAEGKPAFAITSFQHTLYIQEQGSILKKEGNRFLVIKDEKELLDIPAIKVREIIIFGSCIITPAAMQYCLKAYIPIIILSSRGKFFGRIESTEVYNGELSKLQALRTLDQKFLLDFSKQVVTAKINNSRVLIMRRLKRKQIPVLNDTVAQLKKVLNRLSTAQTLDEVRGYEGNAASIYFKTFACLFDPSTGFYSEHFERTKQPPTDPINSLLSFGYTLLNSNITSFLYARNLNPYIGFIHSIRSGHPALSSDVIEEFRNLVDSLVVQTINRNILTSKDFYYPKEPSQPCFLTNEARKEFIRQFEIKMQQKTTHALTGFKVDYLRCIDLQVQHLVQYVKGERDKYQPFTIIF